MHPPVHAHHTTRRCINLANEQLHYFFNQHIFAAELGSYVAEGLDLDAEVMFHDNKAVLDVFFRRNPPGILGLLDEESRFPKANASSLLNKFNKNLGEDALYNVIKGDYAFGVSHYAGNIVYVPPHFTRLIPRLLNFDFFPVYHR